MSNDPYAAGAPRKKGVGCIIAAACVLGLLVIAYVTTVMFQPERLADVNQCRGPYEDAEPPFENTCDYPVNTQLCLYGTSGGEVCRTIELAPGEGFDRAEINADLATLDGLLRPEVYTCKAPYLPGQVIDPNNKQLKAGCLPITRDK